jgi:hypothetical protein
LPADQSDRAPRGKNGDTGPQQTGPEGAVRGDHERTTPHGEVEEPAVAAPEVLQHVEPSGELPSRHGLGDRAIYEAIELGEDRPRYPDRGRRGKPGDLGEKREAIAEREEEGVGVEEYLDWGSDPRPSRGGR